eukprot:CAMPEP_0203831550 /NCGR_PEP_ID=MMETSP0115-20131106/68577_1 /ASSEMBLY_ACC=CAM_ASM_000227 /TAXON_ID=33651 /ORGANISM="Bicosoecid sp, Strain ms1" /LENGTH=38 /DNA_ID= /DNA_START= /DNA_END= /DNA_ORIENTATION=
MSGPKLKPEITTKPPPFVGAFSAPVTSFTVGAVYASFV